MKKFQLDIDDETFSKMTSQQHEKLTRRIDTKRISSTEERHDKFAVPNQDSMTWGRLTAQEWRDLTPRAIRKLIGYGWDPNSRGKNGASVLHRMAGRSSQNAVATMIHLGASVYYRDNKGRTPLEMAVLSNNLKNARILCRSGSRVNSTNDNNQSLLYISISKCYNRMTKFLVSEMQREA